MLKHLNLLKGDHTQLLSMLQSILKIEVITEFPSLVECSYCHQVVCKRHQAAKNQLSLIGSDSNIAHECQVTVPSDVRAQHSVGCEGPVCVSWR